MTMMAEAAATVTEKWRADNWDGDNASVPMISLPTTKTTRTTMTKKGGGDPPPPWQHCSGELMEDHCERVLMMSAAGHWT
jgi:hypothetical protein